jgi:AraC-like DNA-binding protein
MNATLDAMDPLSELLGALRLESSVISVGHFDGDWAVRSERVDRALFHAVLDGTCCLHRDGGTPLRLSAGQVAVLSAGDAHVMRALDAVRPPRSVRALPGMAGPGGARVVRWSDNPPQTRILCGTFSMQHPAADGLLSMLPPVLHMRTDTPSLQATLTLLAAETEAWRPGAGAAITRLIDLLFIHLLRHHVAELPAHVSGLLGALSDAQVAQAMSLMHRAPAHPWTVAALAQQVGLSRSAFAARFAEWVGVPPMAYLTQWRAHVAVRLLRDEKLSVAAVAEQVGYSAEDAFVRAFRRVMQQTPARWRRAHRQR